MANCPCCGHQLERVSIADLRAAVGPVMRRILDVVAEKPGISGAELADLVYGDQKPKEPAQTLAVTICRENARIKPLGWTVSAQHNGAARGYRLVSERARREIEIGRAMKAAARRAA